MIRSSTCSNASHPIGVFVIATALAVALATAPVTRGEGVVAVKAGTIVPVTAEPITDGIILIRDGKIEAVGPDVDIPDGATVIDAADKVVIPGLIDAFTTLAERRDDEGSVTPDVRAKDAFDFYGDYHRILAGGVTTVYISPGQRRLVSGLGAVVRLGGPAGDERCLSDQAGLRITLGELSKNPPAIFEPPLPPEPNNPLLPEQKQLPTTRMAQMAVLRRLFAQAKLDGEASSDLPPAGRQVLASVLEGNVPVRVNCHNIQDIHNALALATTFELKLILEGATEAYQAVDIIKDGATPVVLTGTMSPGRRDARDYTRDIATGRIDPACPATLAAAGIRFALSAPDDTAVADLQFVAGHAVMQGLAAKQALEAITIVPAEILGVADRLGSIEPGKDADLVILSDEPFRVDAKVERTIIQGETVYQRKVDDPNVAEKPTLAIRAGRILTASQGQIDDGLILVKDATISYVGPAKEIPEGTPLLDAGDGVVIPGLIDIHSHLGLHSDSEPIALYPSPATSGPNSNSLRLVSIVNALAPGDAAFDAVRRHGVTSVLLAPPTTGMVSGNAAVIKTAGDSVEDMVVKEYAAVKFSMLGGSQRLAQIWQARSLLKRAKEYAEEWDRYEREHREYEHRQATAKADEIEEPKRPRRDTSLELLRGLFQRKMPALVEARRADEIRNVLKVFRDEYNLDVIILGGDDSARLLGELKESRADVAIGPDILQYDKGRPVNNGDLLARQGLRVAFHTSATSGTQHLPVNAAYAVRHGMDKSKALRAVTSYPAEMLNLNDRIGSIDVGKDADLVILSGEPFEFTSRVRKVIVSGKVVFETEE